MKEFLNLVSVLFP